MRSALFLAVLFLTAFARCADPDKRDIYLVEYSLVAGAHSVDLVFTQPAPPEKVEEYLRIQLATAARFSGITDDMIAFAYLEQDGKTTPLQLTDGSSCMVLRKGQYITGKQAHLIGE